MYLLLSDMKPLLVKIFVFALFLLSYPLLTIQAQIDHYVVLIPTHTSSGQYAGDYDIKGTKLLADGYIKWGAGTPKSLSEMPVKEYDPTAIPDGEDGLFLTYTIEHTDTVNQGDRDVIIRRIDSDGNDIWNDSSSGPVLLLAQSVHIEEHPKIVPTGEGVIVFYEIEYTSGKYKGEKDIAAVRVDRDGSLAWEKAVWIANSDNYETIVDAWPDNQGNAIVLFEKNTASSPSAHNSDLVATRISQDGEIGWGTNENLYTTIAGSPHSEQNAVTVPDGEGGAFIAYELRYVSGSRNGDVDIIAQHLAHSGKRLWVDSENPPIISSNSKALEVSPSIAADSLGITVGFMMEFTSNDSSKEPLKVVGAQRLDYNGYPIWNGGDRAQVILAKDRIVDSPSVIPDGSGGTYIVMEGIDTATGDRDVFAQLLDQHGKRLWGKKGYGIPVFTGPMPEQKASAISDSYGGLIVIAVEKTTYRIESTQPSKDSTIIAQRMDVSGKPSWGGGESNLVLARCQIGEHEPTVVQTK